MCILAASAQIGPKCHILLFKACSRHVCYHTPLKKGFKGICGWRASGMHRPLSKWLYKIPVQGVVGPGRRQVNAAITPKGLSNVASTQRARSGAEHRSHYASRLVNDAAVQGGGRAIELEHCFVHDHIGWKIPWPGALPGPLSLNKCLFKAAVETARLNNNMFKAWLWNWRSMGATQEQRLA